jgi:hypothetical protein
MAEVNKGKGVRLIIPWTSFPPLMLGPPFIPLPIE